MKTKQLAGYLIILENSSFPKKIAFFEGENMIGRNPAKAEIAIKDLSISEKHAKLTYTKEKLTLKDVGSKNGIYIGSLENRLEKDR
jgi:pSer/pThr/pTyr-binding forkhead associated (FHA) protein